MREEPSSPVCYASEADDIYMGYAGKVESFAALNELLEAERAAVKVTLASIGTTTDPIHRDLMKMVHADEARWCAMLSRWVRWLGGGPSRKTGAFRAKALAIRDPHRAPGISQSATGVGCAQA